MDFDSSSKFISSLAKFLQSLCNGYVEFDKGVEIIGHIYLSVDTGKKIDYVLNEKVCKTNENSVKFISNSFHAQPAVKPKPADEQQKPAVPPDPPSTVDDNEIILMDEPEIDEQQSNVQLQLSNVMPHNASFQLSQLSQLAKRTHSQSFSPSNRSFNFKNKLPKVHNPTHSNSSQSSNQMPRNNGNDNSLQPPVVLDPNEAEKDVKPVLALDQDMTVVDVKQEFDPSFIQGCHDGSNTYEEQQLDANYFSQDQSYDSNDYNYGDGSHSKSEDYDAYGNPGSSTTGGAEMQGSTNVVMVKVKDFLQSCPVSSCNVVVVRSKYPRHWRERHERMVACYTCPHCPTTSKRKFDLSRHSLAHHGTKIDTSTLQYNYCPNKDFIDPYPFTLDSVRDLTL